MMFRDTYLGEEKHKESKTPTRFLTSPLHKGQGREDQGKTEELSQTKGDMTTESNAGIQAGSRNRKRTLVGKALKSKSHR